MPDMRRSYEEMAAQTRAESLGYGHYLFQLLNFECEERWQNRIAQILRPSQLPPLKTFENFDKMRLPIKVDNHLNVLLDGSFLSRSENILAFGNPGGGKNHLLCVIDHELISQGKQVLFIACSRIVQNLLIAKKELELTKKLKSLSRFDTVIIDDIGYVQQSREEMEVLVLLPELYIFRGSVPSLKSCSIQHQPSISGFACGFH